MVRKRKTELPGSSGTSQSQGPSGGGGRGGGSEGGGGSAAQAPVERPPQQVPQSVSQQVPQSVSQQVPQSVSQQVPQSVSQQVPQSVSQQVPQSVSQQVPQQGGGRGWAQPPQFGSRGGHNGGGGGYPRGQAPPQYGGRGGFNGGGGGYPQRPGSYQGAPPVQYGGRGAPQGRGGYQQPQVGTVPPQYAQPGIAPPQHGGPPVGYQARGPQQPQPRGISFQQTGGPMLQGGATTVPVRGRGVSTGDPSRPPVPELHQATPQVSYPAANTSAELPSQVSSEATASEASSSQVAEQFQQLSVEPQGAASSQAIKPVAPSSKSARFPARPGKGTSGTKCIVKANHFCAKIQYSKELYHYDVSITPEVTSRVVNKAIMETLVKLYKVSYLGKRLPVYDGRKSLYTAGELPFVSKEFEITLQDEEDGSTAPRRERKFKVAIKLAGRPDLHHLEMFLQGKVADVPQEALQVLDIVLRELPSSRCTPVGRSFYYPAGRQPLGEGLESWRGYYQSIRPTQMGLSLNIDMSSTAFLEPLPVIQFVSQLLNRDVLSRPLSDADRVKIKKALRNVKVEVTHRGNMRRKYRIFGITPLATRELDFPVDEQGTKKSVVQYFRETYGFVIQHTSLPCLQVGNQQRPNYLPMEVCKIVEGQRYSKRLNEKQITALLRVTCQRPSDRQQSIVETAKRNDYRNDPYAQEFGIQISNELASVEARVLPPPWLKYHETGRDKDCLPQIGQWNMMGKKMVNGGRVTNWMCINFSRNVQDDVAGNFCYELALMCQTSGMIFNPDPVLPSITARPDLVERVLKARYHDVMAILRGKDLDLLVVILPDNNGSLYGELKRICETDLGIVSQCCLTKHVFKMSKQYLANVALKINVKVGGRNTVLVDALARRMPLVSGKPTIIFGADVTHPHPGEDSSPSIAAVVASQDWPEVTKYAGLVSAQTHREEIIQDLYTEVEDPVQGRKTGGMIKELLLSFYKATGRKPEQIIFYRDGVSEGQFYQVLFHELDKIRQACASLGQNYQPPVTFVVVQKRHHTRLFANNHADRRTTDKSGNILPGTVVDTKICHPTEFDFYLCSHAGIQGTSRPAHYHVLYDENKFTADALQTLTNNLCYTYARCTRSVSIVPPAYYAHLAAFRARFYMEPESTDSGSMASGPAGRGAGGRGVRVQGANVAAVKQLPALKENVKKVMFYC